MVIRAQPSALPGTRRVAIAIWLALAAVALATQAAAVDHLPGPVPARVLRVIDGDTIEVRARIWLGLELTVLVRIAGIDTPELRGLCDTERAAAQEAKLFAARSLGMTDSGEPPPITLHEIEFGKYANRVVARVTTASGADLGQALTAAGLARAYDGAGRDTWCEAAQVVRD